MRNAAFWVVAMCLAGMLAAHEPGQTQKPVRREFTPAQVAAAEKELVDLESLNAGLRLDIRYATTNNFTGVVLYPVPKAYLTRRAAHALASVQKDLARQGLGLKVFDGYRPLPVQQKMWDLIRDDRYVSNPAVNAGRHTRGTAVDVTLVDILTGRELPMPSAYDDFSERAHVDFRGGTAVSRRNAQILREAMVRHGFEVFPFEWWHFDLKGWEGHPPLAVDLETLVKRDRAALR